ncbi:S8 family peptidase [Staphylococcus pseudintermedius]|nr:S8 family peptidase [Staphylococcus pseudintermedius]
MNSLLQLKGRFEQKTRSGRSNGPQLPKKAKLNVKHVVSLMEDLVRLKEYWSEVSYIEGCLISAYYIKVAAKSNRITGFFSHGNLDINSTVVGAKFSSGNKKHIITHYIEMDTVVKAIENCEKVIEILNEEFGGEIKTSDFNANDRFSNIKFNKYKISKSKFKAFVVDSYYIEKFDVELPECNTTQQTIVTLYKVGENIQDVLKRLNIKVFNERMLDDTTILLDSNHLQILLEKAPYLVSMATEDLTTLAPEDFEYIPKTIESGIPSPSNEPTIGVIDTLFDERVYFSEWVEYHDMVHKSIPREPKDYNHGTAVSSIIVDGARINPNLDDGCGRFKVRHFGVANSKSFSSFTIIKSIKEIIASNKDICVWNLSLGSNEEVNENFISAEAAILDNLQYENDIVFVVAGTNKKKSEKDKRIGAPADSINSVVVNSVGHDKRPADYTRKGIVLSFFTKPDISYYGGTNNRYMKVCEPLGEARVTGTSYAAPWIARKLCYLIEVMGLNKEVAKALLIDSSIDWGTQKSTDDLSTMGHGIVPIKINEILKSKNDEIKFIVSGTSEKYDTFNYNFPVPIHNNGYPYVAKATLCYFPKCSRNQGVDYTNTELDLYFGRITDEGKIKSIDNNTQSIEDNTSYLYEEDARKIFRKWDNIKNKTEKFTISTKSRKVYSNGLWGMSIKTKERLSSSDGEGINFGVVVTLKEINGVNRIEEFIQQCSLKGWLVNKVDVSNRIEVYQKANEELHLE